jgi:hypothetical protein
MQVVFNVLVVVGCSIEKVGPGFCLLALAGRRQPAAPPPVAVRQSSGRPAAGAAAGHVRGGRATTSVDQAI